MSIPRSLLVAALLVILTGCVTVTSNDQTRSDGPEPTARDVSDGVETWDLTEDPSAAAFGVAEESFSAEYQSDEPRQIVLEFGGGESLRFEAPLISFTRARGADGDRYTVGVRGATVEPDRLTVQLRDIVEQLGASPALVDSYAAQLADAPSDQTDRVRFSSPSATFGDLKINVAANVAPIAGYGRFVIGGAWS